MIGRCFFLVAGSFGKEVPFGRAWVNCAIKTTSWRDAKAHKGRVFLSVRRRTNGVVAVLGQELRLFPIQTGFNLARNIVPVPLSGILKIS
jgi:hypothetical protein